MRKPIYIVVVGVACLASCGSQCDTQERQGRNLFLDEKRLLQSYIDSMKHMPDSVDVTEMMRRYQEKLWSLNSSYPADTDLELTQGENDTIYALTQDLLEHAEQRGLKTDTVITAPGDSIPRL